MEEEWRSIEDYDGIYEVSNNAIVRSLDRYVRSKHNSIKFCKGQILKPHKDKDGYLRVRLCKNGKSKGEGVHRIVLKAFISNPENKPQCNHINGIKDDNRLTNIEWCTISENTKHAWDNGLNKSAMPWLDKFGKDHCNSRPIIQLTLNNEFVKEYDSQHTASRETGIAQSNISMSLNKKTGIDHRGNTFVRTIAGGYKWKYKYK